MTWRDQALCRLEDAALFDYTIDDDLDLDRKRRIQVAKKICEKCSVKEPCLGAAILAGDSGVRAGLVILDGRVLAR